MQMTVVTLMIMTMGIENAINPLNGHFQEEIEKEK